ncbi:MAG: SCO6745 family protein [Acidimicrobiales bacterium]
MGDRSTRRRWTAFEPLHAVVYFAPEVPEADRALGLKGFWMSYFAGRAAPLGPVGPELVTATFYNFAPPMVARALPDAWGFASPEAVVATRLDAVDRVLRRVLADAVGSPDLLELAALAGEAADRCPIEGRPLAAAWSSVEPPALPHQRLWLALTVLREHRGDGHVTALVEAGLDGLEVHVLLAAVGAVTRESQLRARGWTDEQWTAAAGRLAARGLVVDGELTDAGRTLNERIEATTDRLAAVPWTAIGADATARFDQLIDPLAARVAEAGVLSYPNPMGLPRA